MAESLSHCLQQVVAYLPDEAAVPIKGNLTLTLLDGYTDGVPAEEPPSGSGDQRAGPDRAGSDGPATGLPQTGISFSCSILLGELDGNLGGQDAQHLCP